MVYLIINFLIITLDQITKNIVKRELKVEEKREVYKNKVYLWHRKNTGISFSLLSKHTNKITAVTFVMTIAGYAAFLLSLALKGSRALKFGFAVALGGAVGNLIDRVRDKKVTDFIYLKFGRAPIFNIADICIFFGALISSVNIFNTTK